MGALSVGDLVASLTLNDGLTEAFSGVVEAATRGVEMLEETLGGLPEVAEGAFAALGVGAAAVGALTAAVVALGEHGSDVQDVTENFDALTESLGMAAGQGIAALRAGTMGLVSDTALMQSANKALSAGWQANAADMETVGAAAVILSKRIGLEGGTAAAYEELMNAMTTGRTRSLAQLGVFVDMTSATDALGGSTKTLSGSMQSAAGVEEKRAEVMKTLAGVVASAGEQELTFADRIQLAKVGVTNFVDALSLAVAESPAINTALQAIDSALIQAFGADKQSAVTTLTGYIDKFAVGVVQGLAYAVQALDYLGTALYYVAAAEHVTDAATAAFAQQVLVAAQAVAIATEFAQGFSSSSVALANMVTSLLKSQTAALQSHSQAAVQDVQAGLAWDTKMSALTTTLQTLASKMATATAVATDHAKALHSVAGAAGEASAADQALAQKIGDWEKATGVLDIEIKNALESGEDLTQVTAQFGTEAHKAATEAANLGIPLAAIPNRVYDINEAFKSSVIADAIAKLNEQAQKTETSFINLNLKASQLATNSAWTSLGTSLTGLVTLGDQWTAKFTSQTDLITAKANAQKDALKAEWQAGTISAQDYAVALAEITQLEQRAIADVNFQQWQTALGDVASAFSNLGTLVGGVFGTILTDLGKAVTGTQQFAKGLNDINTSESTAQTIGGYANAVSGAASSGFAVSGALGGGVGGGAAGGALSGAEIGSIIPGVGTVVGAVIGGIGGAISGLFGGSAGRDAVQSYVDSQGGFDKLHQELGQLGKEGEQLWVNLTQGVGSNNPDQAKAAIDAVTQALAARAQGLTDATTGVSAALKVTSDAYSALAADKDKLTSILANATPGQPLSSSDQSTVSQLNADMATQQGIIDATGLKSQQAASGVAASLVGIVDANLQAGNSFMDAVRNVGPAVQALQAQLDATGYSGGAAFDFIKKEVDLANDAIAGPAIAAVEGYTAGMKGLAAAGALTQDEFTGLTSTIGSTYQSLIAQGKDGKAVMAALQPDLQAVWEAEQQFGFVADDATQALVNQGVQSGLVGEKQKSSTQQMIDALNHMSDTLDAIANGGFGNLAARAQQAAGSIQDSFDGIKGPTIDIDYNQTTSGSAPAGYAPPQLAEGGIVDSPTLAVVGEAGPEAVMPLPDLSALVAAGSRQGGGDTYQNTFAIYQQPGEDPNDLADRVVQRLITSGAQRTTLVNQGVVPILKSQGLV